ncbi:MAG: UDP-4-amino-4,6-dideoxy-N-acetyl-beta-L-altrosamine transaminase [Gammaproteobacteria bacterium]
MKQIPYGHQDISEADISAVNDVLHSDWLTQGPLVDKFEEAVANYCNAKYAVSVCNATAALHLACLALDIKKGDYVWTSPNTFLASANCALYCGASIDFVDIDPKTYNLSIESLTHKLEIAAKNNKLPKLILPVHFAGQSCDMRAIRSLADKYKFYVVEDASHAIGGKYYDHNIGDCAYSDMAVFSFHPVKIITTGEGGMIMTNKKELCEKLKLLRSHGMTRNPETMVSESHGTWYYQQIALGYNYRLTDLQCALGLSQLSRIDEFVDRRHELVKRYNQALKDLPVILPFQEKYNYSAFHLYVIQLKLDQIKKTRGQVFDELRAAGIGVAVHYIPVHLQPHYRQFGFKEGDYPEAEKYYDGVITLPLYFGLSESEQDFVITSARRLYVR